MPAVYFRTADLRPLIRQAREAAQHMPASPEEFDAVEERSPAPPPDIAADPVPAKLLLVHDVGLYLTSNAQERLELGELREVCYAQGLDPRDNPDWWMQVRAAVGGDHFTEAFDAAQMEAVCDYAPDGWIGIEFEDEKIKVSAVDAPTSSPKAA